MKPRIFFVTNWAEVDSQPTSGGPKILVQHIEILNRNAFDARLVLGERKGWFRGSRAARPAYAISWREFVRDVTDRDYVVIPAIRAEDFRDLPGRRKVFFVQNGALLFHSVGLDWSTRYPWNSPELKGIICESEYDRGLLDLLSPRCPVLRVFNSIDHEEFPFVPWENKEHLMVTAPLLPYKNPWHTATATHLVLSRAEAGVGVNKKPRVRVIQGVQPSEVPRLLGRAKILVFPSIAEGFGLLPAEAMLCGTVVVAYRGQAYGEFLPGPYLHDPGDFTSVVQTIEAVLSGDLDDQWRTTIRAARKSAERYDSGAQEESVLDAWARITEG